MKEIILYGAGKFAQQNISAWQRKALRPRCFADADPNKYGKKIEGIIILPLSEALNLYPQADIYITVGIDALGRITKYLSEERKISIERIKYPYPVETRLGCKFIGTRFQLFGQRYATCCSRPEKLGGAAYNYDKFKKTIESYHDFCEDLLDTLRSGKEGPCAGCAQLRYDLWPQKPQLETIGFDTAFEDNRCNFNCIYCGVKIMITDKVFKANLIDMLQKFEEYSHGAYRNIVLASGEISVSPYRNQVFDIIKRNKWDIHVFTNASGYIPSLADLISEGRAKIQVSMDAGTKESFKNIKGPDRWELVCDNLHKYAQRAKYKGQIELKYILLPGFNDNPCDIQGFTALAQSLKANIFLSSDSRYQEQPLPEKTYQCALQLVKICKEKDINFELVSEFFNPNSHLRLLKEGGLKQNTI